MSTEIGPSVTPSTPAPSTPAPSTPAPSTPAPSTPAPSTRSATPADRLMRRVLRLPEGKTSTAAEARSAFQTSLLISATRCVLMYIFFPFVLPLIGVAKGVGPAIGLVIGVLAIVSITFSIRRFWRADHSKRWHYTAFGIVVIGFLVVLLVKDLGSLLS
jgi:hypothetical protein